MRILVWLVRAILFFTLFAFALNNQEPATVHWFFGVQWRAPMVVVVLIAFLAGCAAGVLAMLPSWWRLRRGAQRTGAGASVPDAAAAAPVARSAGPSSVLPSGFGPDLPRREGL
jgi:uncharacterized integral membrane protein